MGYTPTSSVSRSRSSTAPGSVPTRGSWSSPPSLPKRMQLDGPLVVAVRGKRRRDVFRGEIFVFSAGFYVRCAVRTDVAGGASNINEF
ncbi:hypothetical protein GWI33_010489 [Rhynchophorus ferrugineus]|uniref:Uncharacterized protein n=1 Tax=Rhynchophorus ferrugineus TaxID=354439 RepID=A0A834IX96_RHYFE|nr:hypothetical protein GWI33_010489 [Rhynchophorus ferrugineus]